MSDTLILEREVPVADRIRSREPLIDPVYEAPVTRTYDFNAPLLEGQDMVALVLSLIMALGPLTMYALGYGL